MKGGNTTTASKEVVTMKVKTVIIFQGRERDVIKKEH